MQVEEILSEIDIVLENAVSLPFTKGKGIVDAEKIKDLVLEIRNSLPHELGQATAIVADRNKIINDAREESQDIIARAQEKAEAFVKKEEIVKQAQTLAKNINQEAEVQAKDLKKAASNFVEELMKTTDEVLLNSVSELRKARQDFKEKHKNS